MDKNILSKLTYGMYIISTKHEDKMAGFVVNTLTQIAEDPDRIAFAVRKASTTGNLIEKSKRF
ncbi:MAG: flavin reductase, partial [Clostridia bacterium]|nr:flavin reductase [Clostridia bacterium]